MKVEISKLIPNDRNPRTLKDEAFMKLVQSLKDFPEMADAREIVVNKDFKILGGNMRYRAMKEAGWTEAEVKVVDWSEEKQREFIIKDNVNVGEWDWDMLANEWDLQELGEWGVANNFERIANDDEEEINAEDIDTEHTCPKCGFVF